MNESLTQRMLNVIYKDPTVRRPSKDALADWILDTQPRTRPLSAIALIEYLAGRQPDLYDRLRSNIRLQEDLALPALSRDPNGSSIL